MNAVSFFPAAARAAAVVRERLFPSGCARCGKPLVPPDEALRGLCRSCQTRFSFSDGGRRCLVCGRPLVSEREICMSCRRTGGRSFDRVLPLFPYRGDYQKVLRAYKFGGRRFLGCFFAECLYGAAGAFTGPGEKAPVWVPVPPRPGKPRKTGWDQVEFLARVLERNGVPVCRCLKRLRSAAQKSLDREERRLNLQGKFTLNNRPPPETALLFDDVFTTGSTMEACAGTLKEGGAARVYGICLFYSC